MLLRPGRTCTSKRASGLPDMQSNSGGSLRVSRQAHLLAEVHQEALLSLCSRAEPRSCSCVVAISSPNLFVHAESYVLQLAQFKEPMPVAALRPTVSCLLARYYNGVAMNFC